MAYEVVWSSRAIEGVEAIAIYISADSAAYAAAVVKEILTATRTLSRSRWREFVGYTILRSRIQFYISQQILC